MLSTITGGSGCGKSTLVLAYAAQPVLLCTPDKARAIELRKQLRAKDRIAILPVSNLPGLLRALRKHGRQHEGLVVVDEFRALCNATMVAYTEGEDDDAQDAEAVPLSVWFALKRSIVAVLAELAGMQAVLLTQTIIDADGMVSPAAGTKASSMLIREATHHLVPLVRAAQRLAWMEDDGLYAPPRPRRAAKPGKKAGKKAGKKGKKKAKPPQPVIATPTHLDTLARRVAALGVDWEPVPHWDVVADMTQEYCYAQSPVGLTSVMPPYLPLLMPESMIARPDKTALAALRAVRAGETRIAQTGYSRIYLALQGQIAAWGNHQSVDRI